MKKNVLIIGAVILIFVMVFWYVGVVPIFEKLPDDYGNEIDYKRTSNTNHQIGGEWTGEKFVKGNSVEKTLNVDGNVQLIEGKYTAQELDDFILWAVNKNYSVDRKTRKIVSDSGNDVEDSYYLFPTNLGKEPYNIWITQYIYPIKVEFVGIEKTHNLEVYHYESKNFIFDDSEGFGWLDNVPELYNVLADGTVNIYVEPKTGIIVNYTGGGIAYFVDKNTGEKIQGMQTWSNSFTEDTITTQVIKAQNEKFKLLMVKTIIPILLAVVVIVISIFISFKRKES